MDHSDIKKTFSSVYTEDELKELLMQAGSEVNLSSDTEPPIVEKFTSPRHINNIRR